MVAMIVPMFWIGIYPETFLRRLHPPVLDLLHVMETRSARLRGPATARARAQLAAAIERGRRAAAMIPRPSSSCARRCR